MMSGPLCECECVENQWVRILTEQINENLIRHVTTVKLYILKISNRTINKTSKTRRNQNRIFLRCLLVSFQTILKKQMSLK